VGKGSSQADNVCEGGESGFQKKHGNGHRNPKTKKQEKGGNSTNIHRGEANGVVNGMGELRFEMGGKMRNKPTEGEEKWERGGENCEEAESKRTSGRKVKKTLWAKEIGSKKKCREPGKRVAKIWISNEKNEIIAGGGNLDIGRRQAGG